MSVAGAVGGAAVGVGTVAAGGTGAVGAGGGSRTPVGMDAWVRRMRGACGRIVGPGVGGRMVDGGRAAIECGEMGGVAGSWHVSSEKVAGG